MDFGGFLHASFIKKLCAQLCVQKRSCWPWNSDAFRTFSACKVYKKVLGAYSRYMRPKTKRFAVKFRRILDVFVLRGLWRKFWAYFHDLCVQKWSCFLRRSDALWKISPCEVYKNSSVQINTIYASKNEAVCREVQTHFGSFLRASFIERIWAHFLDFCVKKWTCLLLSSDAFWKFLPDEVYGEISGRIFTIYASKN